MELQEKEQDDDEKYTRKKIIGTGYLDLAERRKKLWIWTFL